MNRRETLKLIAAASLAAGLPGCTPSDVQQARDQVSARQAAGTLADYKPAFFTPEEYATVHVLADLVLPADDRSGSATDAGVPAFMDFMMTDRETLQTPMRGGLRWLDYQCHKRFGRPFRECTGAEQTALLDTIAYPETAAPEMSQGVAFFNLFRDLTASGFWSSRIGVEDLAYTGNTAHASWDGCPREALDHLGVGYS